MNTKATELLSDYTQVTLDPPIKRTVEVATKREMS